MEITDLDSYDPEKLLHPELYKTPRKTSPKMVVAVVASLLILVALFLAIFFEKAQYKKDLQINIKKKVKIIQDSESLLVRAHSDFNLVTFCQQNTDTPDCSSLDVPFDKIVSIDNKFTEVIEMLIKYHNNPAQQPLSPKPTAVVVEKCPKTAYVDCMPGPGVTKPECETNYLQWAKENCPNFKGAAL
jgi:hypothetical protein